MKGSLSKDVIWCQIAADFMIILDVYGWNNPGAEMST
jgi:hypothetical protein